MEKPDPAVEEKAREGAPEPPDRQLVTKAVDHDGEVIAVIRIRRIRAT